MVAPAQAQSRGTVLSAHRLSKVFWMRGAKAPFQVLKGVSLSVKAGEWVAIVGPSGSGKSTLLRCLAGLEPATDGHVTLLDANLARASRTDISRLLREQVGVLLARSPLVPALTVLQNVELPGLLAARSNWSTRELALRTLADLGAEALANLSPDQLTPAQAGLVSLARVLAQNPRVVFADEPTGRLTVEESQLVIAKLHELTAKGCAVVLTTQDLHLAAHASRVVILVDGVLQDILAEPSASEILEVMGQATHAAIKEAAAQTEPEPDSHTEPAETASVPAEPASGPELDSQAEPAGP